MKRIAILVLDSVGVGALPDAHLYGDEGSNTLGHVAKAVGGLQMPNAKVLGLGNIIPVEGVAPLETPQGAWGKMAQVSKGKDTTTGHWEIAGLNLEAPFPTYADGFPAEILVAFEEKIGRKTLGNYPASGTAIIEELGAEHIKTGFPIVYTSADSVFQIAAHEDIVPLTQLYAWCEMARDLLQGDHAVGRVIARPFTGEVGSLKRTPNRKDYSLPPFKPTILDTLTENSIPVYGVGKISDIFAGRGISASFTAKSNKEVLDGVVELLRVKQESCLIFANLVDFDMIWGHRNDAEGYGRGLEQFDQRLPEVLERLGQDDLLIIVADHGCDPTFPGTDHTREYVPLLVAGPRVEGVDLGTRRSFSDVAKTIAEFFALEYETIGISFLTQVRN
ncbi:MAG: phosphopentomutase [Limnochordia bacterium]|jgi:phosphopentomutase|nr:phosphopentomutase [Limnochordia bacterium]